MATKDESTLTDRQREVLSLIREDKAPKEIAKQMGVGDGAIYEHMRVLRDKGFLPKNRRRRSSGNNNGRSSTPAPQAATPVASSNGTGRVGKVVAETLRRAVQETDEAIEAQKAEMSALSQRQHDLAQEVETLAEVKTDIEGEIEKVKALA